jgi:molybdenum cofactor biosynthesis protein B
MSVQEHKEKAKKSIGCFVVTVSDTRDEVSDTSGQAIQKYLRDEGHQTTGYRIVKDEPVEVEAVLNDALANAAVEAVIVNGGTGIAPRDSTYEVVSRFMEKSSTASARYFAI